MEYEYEFVADDEVITVSVAPFGQIVHATFSSVDVFMSISEAKLLHNCLKFAIDAAEANSPSE